MASTLSKFRRLSLRWIVITVITAVILFLFILHITGGYKISFLQNFLPQTGEIYLSDVTEQAGISGFRRSDINQDNPSYLDVMGGGVAVGDVDGDGWEDLFFASMPVVGSDSLRQTSSSALYRNLKDGSFEDITVQAGLDQIRGYPIGALFFDYNNDGLHDLYVAAYDGGELFRNDGGRFTNVTNSAGVQIDGYCGEIPCLVAAASSADYNRDGFLDLLIVNNVEWDINNPRYYGQGTLIPVHYSAQPSILFKNNGDGTFTNVAKESGVTNQDTHGYRENGKGLSAVWDDFNNDGWPDIYIANDMSPNRLYINKKDGTFLEVGAAAYLNEAKSSMGVDAADYDQDGDIDLVTTNLIGQMTSLFNNLGNLRFDYTTYHTGIMPSVRSSGWGIVFVDVDLDGYLDLIMGSGPLWQPEDKLEAKNLFFKNLGNGAFTNITDDVFRFTNQGMTRGVALIDFDRSGTPDLIFSNINGDASQLIKNQFKENNWLRLDLEGVDSNRDAVGTRVIVKRNDGMVQIQTVKAGNSYVSSGSKSLFFGLGNSTIEEMIIRWPSGQDDTLNTVEINRILQIREGEL